MEYQSKNNYLSSFRNNSFQINWTVIVIGLEGPGKFEKMISVKDVADYAISRIEQNDSPTEELYMIAGLDEDDFELAYINAKKMAAEEDNEIEVEIKKWIIILLKDVLNTINPDPLYGLIQLTEFWEKFDYPNFSPHTIQGVDNNITAKEYYTQENLNKILDLHEKWIKKETEKLVVARQ